VERHKTRFIKTSAKSGEVVPDLFEIVIQRAILVRNSGVFERKESAEPIPLSGCY
jgi:hypothetical protein